MKNNHFYKFLSTDSNCNSYFFLDIFLNLQFYPQTEFFYLFQQNAEAKLFLLCAQLPTSVSATCRKLVHEGLPDVLKLLSAFTPDTLCALANLCENKAQTKGLFLVLLDPLVLILCALFIKTEKNI